MIVTVMRIILAFAYVWAIVAISYAFCYVALDIRKRWILRKEQKRKEYLEK